MSSSFYTRFERREREIDLLFFLMIILSFDPGTCNLGFCVSTFSKQSHFKLKFKDTIELKKPKEVVNYETIIQRFNDYFMENKLIKYLVKKALNSHMVLAILLENQYGINKKQKHAIHLAVQMIHMNFVVGLLVGHFAAFKEKYPQLRIVFRFISKRKKWIHHSLKGKGDNQKDLIKKSNVIYLKKTKTRRSFISKINSSSSNQQHWNDACNMAIQFVENCLSSIEN